MSPVFCHLEFVAIY